jgi:hypothetical protein
MLKVVSASRFVEPANGKVIMDETLEIVSQIHRGYIVRKDSPMFCFEGMSPITIQVSAILEP